MRTTMTTTLAILLALAGVRADEPKPETELKAKLEVAAPRFPKPTAGVPFTPGLAQPPDPRVRLAADTWYVIDFEELLLVDWISKDDAGAVVVTYKVGPLHLPAKAAPGREADADDPDFCTIRGPHVYLVKAKTPGTVVLEVLPRLNRVVDGKPIPFGPTDIVRKTVDVLGGSGPRPPPVPTVDPTVEPSEDGTSKTALIAGDGLNVMIGYDALKNDMTAGQRAAVTGKAVRDYLATHCNPDRPATPGDDGRAYRIWPAQEDAAGAPKKWRDAFALAHPKLPWIIISTPKGSTHTTLPKTEAEILSLLKKYGGD